jgi:uncharacterized protein (TIGR02996 family)
MIDLTPRAELLALLAAVKAEPDDDTPKLALADWLEEQDHAADRARGQYLRTLIACAPLSQDDPLRPSLLARLSELWRYHPAWLGSLSGAGFRCWHNSARWGLLLPGIDGKDLVTKKAIAMAGSEEYAWVAGLAFRKLGLREHRRFVNSPLLESLIALDYDHVEPALMVDLAQAPGAAALKYLTIYSGRMGTEGSAAIAGTETPTLRGLRELSLRACDIGGDAGFRLYCDSPALDDLQVLSVSGVGLTIHSARAFADGAGLPSLRELNLEGAQIGSDGTLILIHKASAGRLRKLNISAVRAADYGVEAICRADHLCNLTHLDLSNNQLTDRSAVAIASAEHLGGLEDLNLQNNTIGEGGAVALARGRFLENLRCLNLWRNEVGARGSAALRERFGDRVIL